LSQNPNQTLAAFFFDDGHASRNFLKKIQTIDKADDNVRILDAAIADRTRLGRIKVHQTEDTGALKGGIRGGAIGVVVGTLLLGPAGPVVGGAAGGILAGLHNRFHDIGIDDKWMRQVAHEMEKRHSALFLQYEGEWAASIGAIGDAVKAEHAVLFQSTLPPDTAAALKAMVETAEEELGGEEVVSDYEVDAPAEAAPEVAAAAVAAEVAEPAPVAEAPVAAVSDDLTAIEGVEPTTVLALKAAGVDSFARLAATSEPDLRKILTDAQVTPPENVNTWAMQASFAATGDWRGLMAYVEKSAPRPEIAPVPEPVVEAAAAPEAAGDDLTQLAGIGPKSAGALAAAGITTYAALAEANEPQLRHALHEADIVPPATVATWPMQATFAAKGDWQGLLKYNQKRSRANAQAAKPAGTAATAEAEEPEVAPDDLTQLSGIGPRIESILGEGGVTTYDKLQHTSVEELRQIIAGSGALPPSSLPSWPTQAAYATKGDWEGLATYNRSR